MTDRELMRMALDALEKLNKDGWILADFEDEVYASIEALRARLAQPEPLPAKSKGALSHEENKQHNKKILDKFYEENAHLYTAPPQPEWQDLTDDESDEIWGECLGVFDCLKMTQAKLKEKNT